MKDKNFEKVVNILNKEKIFYWIGQGSLLGIIRDNKLIEWDHDIDICLWDHEYQEKYEFVKLLENEGFKYRDDLGFGKKYDQMSFDKKGGRRVDLNFYQKNTSEDGEEIAFTRWGYPKNIFMSFLDAISNAKNYNSKYKFIINNLTVLEKFAKLIKKFLLKKKLFYREAGYKQPLNLLNEFKKIKFEDLEFNVPSKTTLYLEYIYGKNWKLPQKKFSWWKTKNLNFNYK